MIDWLLVLMTRSQPEEGISTGIVLGVVAGMVLLVLVAIAVAILFIRYTHMFIVYIYIVYDSMILQRQLTYCVIVVLLT